ncbi:hypothetical protein F5Y14DRAFT_465126 [Nemania sp. NC0429]|nr:hypothetical protein F5Y14DRAFT_465126 [Nemania sp. NC0429]
MSSQVSAPDQDVARVLQDILFQIKEMNNLLRQQQHRGDPDSISEDLEYTPVSCKAGLVPHYGHFEQLYRRFARLPGPFTWARVRIVRGSELIGYEAHGAILWTIPPDTFNMSRLRDQKSHEFNIDILNSIQRKSVLGSEFNTIPGLEQWFATTDGVRNEVLQADNMNLSKFHESLRMIRFTHNTSGRAIADTSEPWSRINDSNESEDQRTTSQLWLINLRHELLSSDMLKNILLVLSTNSPEHVSKPTLLWFFKIFVSQFRTVHRFIRLTSYDIFIHCHFRLYDVEYIMNPSRLPSIGLHLCRQRGEFPRIFGGHKKVFVEKRLSAFCISRTTRTGEAPPALQLFKVVVLDESGAAASMKNIRMDGSSRRPKGLLQEDEEKEIPLEVVGTSAAFQLVQVISYQFLQKWKESWVKCIDTLDHSIKVEVEDIGDEAKINELMFDGSFERSKLYFRILQILRIFAERIEEMREDIASLSPANPAFEPYRTYLLALLGDEATTPHAKQDLRALEDNWKIISRFHDEAEKLLLQRIATKTEGIKTLRDGLFNATALREATKGMALNRAIYVFTVVTVIYTPVGFLATFWALPFLNSPSDGGIIEEPAAFRNSFIILPVLTYFLSIFVTWYFGSRHAKLIDGAIRKTLKDCYEWLAACGRDLIRYFEARFQSVLDFLRRRGGSQGSEESGSDGV